jgi:hypothetical protein
MFSQVVAFLVLLLRALPSVAKAVSAAVAEHEKNRERVAIQRLEEKNANVDRAIDAPAVKP